MLERNRDTGDITSIVRLDSQQPPAILYSKQLDSEIVIGEDAEYVEESEVTYHNYTAVEKREEGSQTETSRMEGSTQTNLVTTEVAEVKEVKEVTEVKEGSAQTEEQVEVAEVSGRRKSRIKIKNKN